MAEYRLNLQKFFKSVEFLMLFAGIYPYKSGDILKTVVYYLSKLLTWILGLTLITGMVLRMIIDLDDILKATQTLYIFLTQFAYILKLVFYTIRRDQAAVLVEDFLKSKLFNSHGPEQDGIFYRNMGIVTKMIFIYRTSCVGTVLAYLLGPLINHELPLPGWYPIDMEKNFYLLYIFQVLAIGISALNNSSLDSLAILYITMAAAQLEALTEHLKSIALNRQHARVDSKLRQCVAHHKLILEFVEVIQKQFSFGIFFQFCASCGVICITGFLFLLVPPTDPDFYLLIIYLTCMMAQIAMYCWFGNELIHQSNQIINACYMSEWHEINKEFKMILYIIMERSKRPITIKAGNFFTLSLATLSSILRSSYSYFAVLQRVYKE